MENRSRTLLRIGASSYLPTSYLQVVGKQMGHQAQRRKRLLEPRLSPSNGTTPLTWQRILCVLAPFDRSTRHQTEGNFPNVLRHAFFVRCYRIQPQVQARWMARVRQPKFPMQSFSCKRMPNNRIWVTYKFQSLSFMCSYRMESEIKATYPDPFLPNKPKICPVGT